jgi:hypothetical protein
MILIALKIIGVVIFLAFVYVSLTIRFELMSFCDELIKGAKNKQKPATPKIIQDILRAKNSEGS